MKPRQPSQAEIDFAAAETRAAMASNDTQLLELHFGNFMHVLMLHREEMTREDFHAICDLYRRKIKLAYTEWWNTSATGASALKQTSRDGATNTERGSDHGLLGKDHG